MKTVEQILLEIHQQRPMSRPQLYRYLKQLAIVPKVRQRPARYPLDTGSRILVYLGYPAAVDCGRPGCPNGNGDGLKVAIPTVRELRAARSNSTKGVNR